MSRILHAIPVNSGWSQQQTSTATTDPKTFTPPATVGQKAHACLVSVETTNARVTLNGDAPDATHGHVFVAGQQPVYVPAAVAIKVASTAAANSVVTVTWLA